MLRADSIYVWRVRLDATVSTETLAAWRRVLSVDELRKADDFHRPGHTLDYITAHLALRVVLGRCLEIAPTLVEFAEADEAGMKPALRAGPVGLGAQDIRFNLSHTAGAALIAVTTSREVGIDIEWQRPMDDLEGMARTVMSDDELKVWQNLRQEECIAAFYNLWTRKEAYLKAIGLGLYRSLQDVTVPVSARRLDSLAEGGGLVRDRSGVGSWLVTDLPMAEGYSASVCWEGNGVSALVVRELILDDTDWQEARVPD